jgi:hypothetical protein
MISLNPSKRNQIKCPDTTLGNTQATEIVRKKTPIKHILMKVHYSSSRK